MNQRMQRRPAPPLSRARTNDDLIMIGLGVALIVFFLIAGYTGMAGKDPGATRKPRGPVKDPHNVSWIIEGPRAVHLQA